MSSKNEKFVPIELIDEFIDLIENKETIYLELDSGKREFEDFSLEDNTLSWRMVKGVVIYIQNKRLYKKEYQYQTGLYSVTRVKGHVRTVANYIGEGIWYIIGSERKFYTGDFHEIQDKIDLH